jgi:hypothetical protein
MRKRPFILEQDVEKAIDVTIAHHQRTKNSKVREMLEKRLAKLRAMQNRADEYGVIVLR